MKFDKATYELTKHMSIHLVRIYLIPVTNILLVITMFANFVIYNIYAFAVMALIQAALVGARWIGAALI